jgi:hypothetical protein
MVSVNDYAIVAGRVRFPFFLSWLDFIFAIVRCSCCRCVNPARLRACSTIRVVHRALQAQHLWFAADNVEAAGALSNL